MDCSPPGSSVHVISQARVPEQVAFPSPWASLDAGIEPVSPALADGFFTTEPPGKSYFVLVLANLAYFWCTKHCKDRSDL